MDRPVLREEAQDLGRRIEEASDVLVSGEGLRGNTTIISDAPYHLRRAALPLAGAAVLFGTTIYLWFF